MRTMIDAIKEAKAKSKEYPSHVVAEELMIKHEISAWIWENIIELQNELDDPMHSKILLRIRKMTE